MSLQPKHPESSWLNSFLEPNLIKASAYHIDTPPHVEVKLDQNESPFDWPRKLKKRVVEKLLEEEWNRYPKAYSDELEKLVCDYAGVTHGSVLLAPGSNHLISLILSMFSKQRKGKLVVARPSFALYEGHCIYDGIPYEAWELNKDLQYDVEMMPKLTDGSMVIFASPNNPVGNVLPKLELEKLLEKHPKVLFIADEAYFEFAEEPYTSLLKNYSNLMIVRTFSKTMGAAGVRLGYLLASESYIQHLRKMMLPYLLNKFTLVAAREVLADKEAQKGFKDNVEKIKRERNQLFSELKQIGQEKGFEAINSQANFILLRWPTSEAALEAYNALVSMGVLIRNVSKGPGLAGCLRLTLGTVEENRKVFNSFEEL